MIGLSWKTFGSSKIRIFIRRTEQKQTSLASACSLVRYNLSVTGQAVAQSGCHRTWDDRTGPFPRFHKFFKEAPCYHTAGPKIYQSIYLGRPGVTAPVLSGLYSAVGLLQTSGAVKIISPDLGIEYWASGSTKAYCLP